MLFPKTIAYGESFCNRQKERSRLRYNFENIQHTVVVSPRRYGKTSLILTAINEFKWPYAYIDLFLAFDENKVVERFLEGISNLVAKIIPINVKAIGKIRDFFKSFSVSLIAGDISFSLKLAPTTQEHTVTIRNAIAGLEEMLRKYKKQAIFFIDEIQDIVNTPICAEIEALLRFYAQNSRNISYIFSGSNRKLLHEIFDDRARPLFKMCDRLNLQRISAEDYQDFLNKASQKKWHKQFNTDAIDVILNLTERHSYYVNYLCSVLWQLEKIPAIEQIQATWNQLCDEEANNIVLEFTSLSFNQKKLLEYIARKGILSSPTSHEHSQKLGVTSRGISQSLNGLQDKDIIEKTTEGIRIIDPMLKTILLR